MAKQNDYLTDILAEEGEVRAPAPDAGVQEGLKEPEGNKSELHKNVPAAARRAGSSLLGRESALARVAKGEVRQVTQLLLDPSRVAVWQGNARRYSDLTEENCRELINSVVAEGGQKVPAIVRRTPVDSHYDYEVIAGTRRHFAISWLRAHSYPDMQFLAEVQELDDEAAFRLADIENRARKDVSDIERAQNYAAALYAHYEGHLTRMAARLNISKGWLSKMLKVAALPECVIAAFASPADIKLKPAYPLAQAYDDPERRASIERRADDIAAQQRELRDREAQPLQTTTVLKALLDAGQALPDKRDQFVVKSRHGRPALSVLSQNRQGVTVRLHAGSGASAGELALALKTALAQLEANGTPLPR